VTSLNLTMTARYGNIRALEHHPGAAMPE